jgi:hypothetical protein
MENNWTSTSTSDLQFMSLYDYLGTAAGPTLGKEVAEAATKAKIPVNEKYVSNKKYAGKILMYPRNFLDKYFNNKEIKLPF